MYVGNEFFYKPGALYENENGRLRRKPSEWGRDIYMWWNIYDYVCKDGTVHHYKYFNFSVGGQREQYYCKGNEHYPDKFRELHLMDFCFTHFFLMGSFRARWEIGYRPQKVKIKRKHGRPKAFDPELYDLLEPAGFKTNGSEIVINYKKYFTLEAAAYRFELLSDDDKAVIGEPANLLSLCKQAYSLLKSRNRRAIKTTFEDCFHDNIMEKVGSIDMPTAEQLRTAIAA